MPNKSKGTENQSEKVKLKFPDLFAESYLLSTKPEDNRSYQVNIFINPEEKPNNPNTMIGKITNGKICEG